jgi:hypothetical protein
MSIIAIDINDAGIVVADSSGILATEPGYAFSDNGAIVTGRDAYATARLYPRRSSNRFWDGLSLEQGSAGIDGVGSAAELAYAQLAALWAEHGGDGQEAMLLVPSHYGREQLGILLGLAHECGIPVLSMISSAVAAAAAPYPGFQLLHVDVGLHRVTVTPLEQADEVAAQPERSLSGAGFASILDLLAKRVAELFILSTRFDPFHSAASEQMVYDRLPVWLEQLATESESVSLSLPHGEDELRIEISRNQLIGVLAGFFRAVVQLIAQCREPGAQLVVLLSDRLAAMPGIVGELKRLDDAHVVLVEAGAAPLGALQQADLLGGSAGSVRLLKRLPWRSPSATVEPARQATESRPVVAASKGGEDAPSHIVYRGTAYPVDQGGLLIGREQTPDRRTIVLNGGQTGVSRAHCELVRRDGELKLIDMSRFGTFVNEKRVSGEVALQSQDIIRIGSPGEQLQVIRVESAYGA